MTQHNISAECAEKEHTQSAHKHDSGSCCHNHEGSCEHCHEHNHEHGHGHEHGHDHSHGGEVKKELIKLIPAAILFAVSLILDEASILSIVICLLAYIIVGFETLKEAAVELIKYKSIGECFLMGIASIGAIAIGEYREAAAVMLFYSVGELLEGIASARSRKSITALLDLKPDTVNVVRSGKTIKLSPDEVAVGETITVSAGERIALDGEIISGQTDVDNSALTGESLPIGLGVGDKVYGGSINLSGTVLIRTDKVYSQSSGAKILELVENAQEKKAKTERFISRFARVYTLVVVILSLAVAFIPPIFIGFTQTFSQWLYRGLVVLVASCPCALVISVPLTFFAGVGCASKKGILIKGTGCIEQLSRVETVAFDKTGTLTKGTLRVDEVFGSEDTLRLCAICERQSSHPIARAVMSAYEQGFGELTETAESITEKSGKGIVALINGKTVLCGNKSLLSENGIENLPDADGKTTVYLGCGSEFLGYITLSDEVRADSYDTVNELKRLGVEKTVMLTGDSAAAAKMIADTVGVDTYKHSLSPSQKVDELSKLIDDTKNTTVYIGDGINDSPVIALADVGFAMGGLGSDAAIESADVVILDDNIAKLPLALRISKKTTKIAMQNIAFALLAKLVIVILGIAGMSGMWLAVFADVGVTILAIINSLRAFYFKR